VDALTAVGIVLGGLGAVLAVFATLRGQRDTTTQDKLKLAWEMQEKQLDYLSEENRDLRRQIALCNEQLLTHQQELFACKEGRRALEVQVEILKMRGQG